MDKIQPVSSKELTSTQKQASLQYLMFFTVKENRKMKNMVVLTAKKNYMDKYEVSAPTVVTELLFLTCLIDVMERRDISTVDIPGDFIQIDMDEEVHINLEGKW